MKAWKTSGLIVLLVWIAMQQLSGLGMLTEQE